MVIYLIPPIGSAPCFFAYKIIEYLPLNKSISNLTGVAVAPKSYLLGLTDFGSGYVFQIYLMGAVLMEFLFSICFLGIISVIILVKLKKRMQSKATYTIRTNQQLRQCEARYTKMIILTTCLFVLARSYDMFNSILVRIDIMLFIDQYKEFSRYTTYINFLKETSVLLMFSVHAFIICVYLTMDKKLFSLVKKIWLKKVIS